MTTRRIPPSEWAQHEVQIKHLYLDNGLPVHSKVGKKDLVGTMEEQFGFSATPAQYETWISQQGLSKNFGKAETRLVIGILDQLQAQGFKARALDSGKEIKVDKLKRKRRYAVKTAPGCSGAVLTQHLPPRIAIEVLNATNNSWTPYQSSLSSRGDQSISEASVLLPVVRRSVSPDLHMSIMSSPNLWSWTGSSSTSPFGGLDNLGAFYVPLLPSKPLYFTLYQSLPFYQVVQTLRQQQQQVTGHGKIFSGAANGAVQQTSQALTSVSARSLVGSLVQHAHQLATDLRHNARGSPNTIPDAKTILDSLQSLLPEDDPQDMATQSTEVRAGHDIVESAFHKTLLYSIVNGFAGLQDLPRGAVLRMLGSEQHMSRRLIELVQQYPPSLAKSFTENIFQAAIEGRDAKVVKLIASAARGTPNAIKPDEIVCEFEEFKYTPIELAAEFRDLDMIQALLVLGVDVNGQLRSHGERSKMDEHGALEHAVGFRNNLPALDMRIPRVLLAAGATVRVNLIQAVVERHKKEPELQRELLGRLVPDDHRHYFNLLPDFARCLKKTLAYKTIQRFIRHCVASDCRQCVTSSPKLLKETLMFASKRGNTSLCSFLLGYTRAEDDALAAAIKSGEQEVVALLLEHGAFRMEDTTGTTPLAEAIRRQDDDLIQELERRGAWSQLTREDHFKAAVEAAAEVGNLHLLGKVLQAAPRKHGRPLASALIYAIRKDHTQAALMLLSAGAYAREQRRDGAFISALRQRNAVLIDALLESDVDVTWAGLGDPSALSLAVEWGNLALVDDLIFMGADIDGEALCQAVESRDTALVAHLLDFGANPNRLLGVEDEEWSPLEVAVKNEDTDMIHLLLSRGANPADEGAFVAAAKANDSTLGTLLGPFKKQYANGLGGFGGRVTIKAIEANNEGLLRDLISAKMNVLNHCRTMRCTPLASAIRHGRANMVGMLLDAGARVNGMVAAPLGLGGNGFSDAWPRESPLLVAIETRNEDMFKLLIDRGALVNCPARKGFKRTPLQKACEIGSLNMVKLLLDHGADVNGPPAVRGGGTALQLAAATGSIKIASYLLQHGALVHASTSDVNGRTVLEAAAEKGRIDMIKFLWDAAYPEGFPADQVQKALDFASEEGHVSCADYIRLLAETSSKTTDMMPSSQVMLGGPWTGWTG